MLAPISHRFNIPAEVVKQLTAGTLDEVCPERSEGLWGNSEANNETPDWLLREGFD